MNGNADDLSRLNQLPGDFDIFPTWLQVAARVIVSDNDRGPDTENSGAEHLTRMDQARVQCTFTDDLDSLHGVLAVQNEHHEAFLHETLEEEVVLPVHILRTPNDGASVKSQG